MPVQPWLQVIQVLLTGGAGVVLWRAIQLAVHLGGLLVKVESRFTAIEGRLQQVDQQVDRAGKKISDLATDVQALPERLRQDFVTKEAWNERSQYLLELIRRPITARTRSSDRQKGV